MKMGNPQGRKGEVLSDRIGTFGRLAALAQDDYGSTMLTTGPRRIVTLAEVGARIHGK